MLEQLTSNDYPLVSKLMSDPVDHEKICVNVFSYPLSEKQYIEYFVINAGDDNRRLCFKYSHAGKYLGIANFIRIDRRNDYGRIGLVAIDPSARGSGHGEAMLIELLRKGFDELGFNRVELAVIESNRGGYHFYTNKIGFIDEGLIRDIIKVNNSYLSWHSLSILRADWATKALQETQTS